MFNLKTTIMKKFFILSISLVGFSMSTLASSPVYKDLEPLEINLGKENTEIITDYSLFEDFGRQCCTATAFDPYTGTGVSVTACAGWFLSNSDNAYNRACEKAQEGFESVYGHDYHISTTIQK